MKTITYTCREPEGLHARPAGQLNKAVKPFACSITMTKGEKTADLKRLFALMGLAVKCGDQVTITFDGADEDAAAAAVEEVLKGL